MRLFRCCVFLMLSLGCLAAGSAWADVTIESGPGTTALVELFSSEGCSSCPPADRWFSSLLNDKGLWKDFAPAVFHVTYWDYLGWTDRLAKPEFTERQHAYAAMWGSRNVYTPGIVLNGREWRGWSAGGKPAVNAPSPGKLTAVSRDGTAFSIQFVPTEPMRGNLKVYGALLGFGIEHAIERGENSGKALKHDFVVLELKTADLKRLETGYEGQLILPRAKEKAARSGVVFWLQRENNPEPVQTAGGFLVR